MGGPAGCASASAESGTRVAAVTADLGTSAFMVTMRLRGEAVRRCLRRRCAINCFDAFRRMGRFCIYPKKMP